MNLVNLLLAGIADVVKEAHKVHSCKEGDSPLKFTNKTMKMNFFDKLIGLKMKNITKKN